MSKKLLTTTFSMFFVITLLTPTSSFADVPPDVKAQLIEEKSSAKLSTQISSAGTKNDPKAIVNTKKYGPTYWTSDFITVKRKVSTGYWFTTKSEITDRCKISTFKAEYIDLGEQLTGGPPEYKDGVSEFGLFIDWFLKRESDGVIRHKRLVNRYTDKTIEHVYECVPPPEPIDTPPRGIAPTPTYGDIWTGVYDATYIDGAVNNGVFVLPVGAGLTGLPSKFWMEFTGGQTIRRIVILNGGYVVDSTARITKVEIIAKSPSGNQKVLGSYEPDETGKIAASSYEHPAATYTFRTAGMYTITTAISWSAEASIAAPGSTELYVPIGTLRIDVDRQYRVNQLRAVLTQ